MAEGAVIRAIGRLLTRRKAWWFNLHGDSHGRAGLPQRLVPRPVHNPASHRGHRADARVALGAVGFKEPDEGQ